MTKRLLLTLLFFTLLTGCIPGPNDFFFGQWQYADLRLLDSPGGADPQFDLIAAYARCGPSGLDVRLDLLESIDPWAYDLYLAVDIQPAGSQVLPIGGQSDFRWDLWIASRAGEPIQVRDANANPLQNLKPRIWRNTRLDYVQVRLPTERRCPAGTRIQAFLAPAGEKQLTDATDAFTLDGTPPKRVPLLLSFRDVLPGITPAQALRRWNGAHTGPYGQRHGLAVLLEAVDDYRVPVVLLDLNQPTSLSALEAVGGTAWVRDLARQGLLTLPISNDSPAAPDHLLQKTRRVSQAFDIPVSAFSFDAVVLGQAPTSFEVLHRLFSGQAGKRSIPVPAADESSERQADEGGLSLAAKMVLLEAAHSPDSSRIVTLGGSLPQSEWADSEIARPALEYIATHPWIQPLAAHDLTSWPSTSPIEKPVQAADTSWLCADGEIIRGFDAFGKPMPLTDSELRAQMDVRLRSLPDGGPFTDQAWQALAMLSTTSADCELRALPANYLGEIGYLLAAAQWSQNPQAQADCLQDIDFDGQPECLLSGSKAFAIVEPDGARLAFAALRTEHDVFQIAGLQSQFGVGLSDPLAWRLVRGPRADPYVVSGAFDDLQPPEEPYRWETSAGEIQLTHPQTGAQKTYALFEDGLRVMLSNVSDQNFLVPLTVAPEERFQPLWPLQYSASTTPHGDGIDWGLPNGKRVQVRVDGARFDFNTFRDSAAALQKFEDPNFEYPEGHYLPFPTALLTIHSQGAFSVTYRPEIIP